MLEINKIHQGDCLELMKQLEDNSVDSIVTDPPYGLSFMGKKWDCNVPSVEIWKECLRILKPGGYLLSFAGTRTQHRMACNIEDAGFEIRDMIAWVYGSGFPKSHNIGKAVDKLQGNKREVVGEKECGYQVSISKIRFEQGYRPNLTKSTSTVKIDKGTSEWEGWGTALKPAMEPITIARKPLSEKTVAKNVLKWGTGGINIDGCRVGNEELSYRATSYKDAKTGEFSNQSKINYTTGNKIVQGRFPANFIHDDSEEVVSLFPDSKGQQGNIKGTEPSDVTKEIYGKFNQRFSSIKRNDLGSASRFFYCAKTSKSERNKGCEELETTNNHPTVKPIKLIEYLIKLVSRENSIVVDPFIGSGTTAVACKNLNRNFIGIELDEEYCKIANKRLNETEERIEEESKQKTVFDF